MKIQNMAIILVIILLPITLVLTAYTKTQIDTISVQTMYATRLRDATYDAVTAFQLNTTQNLYSTVSDSMRRDISAAIQTFMGNMAKNLGMSGATENAIKPYIPAIVFTLYDGYYIYSPLYNYNDAVNAKVKTEANGNMVNKNSTGDYTLSGTTKEGANKYIDKFGDEQIESLVVSEYQEQLPSYEIIDTEKSGNADAKYEHVLKPYIYYTVRYVNDTTLTDVVVNYSLDNYIVVYGKVAGEYVTRAGYLVAETEEKNVKDYEQLYRRLPVRTITFTPNENKSMIQDIATLDISIENVEITNDYLATDRLTNGRSPFMPEGYTTRIGKIIVEAGNSIFLEKSEIQNTPDLNQKYINKSTGAYKEGSYSLGWHIGDDNDDKSEDYYVDPESAKKYYDEAIEFTNWVNTKLAPNITAADAIKSDGTKYVEKVNGEEVNIFRTDDKIFQIDENNDPNDEGSIFNDHKRTVIKLSIQDNLAQAIASYNEKSIDSNSVAYDFQLPQLKDTEWDQILKNVCMITFMQGIQAGNKTFNDYAIVTSTKNKEYVSEDSLYFINTSEEGDGKYHKIGCSHLKDDMPIVGYRNTDFDRYSFEYEDFGPMEIDSKGQLRNTYVDKTEYYYMHNEHEACYYCIVNPTKEGKEFQDSWKTMPERAKAFYTAMAREKYNFYKINKYLDDGN